MKYTFNQGFFRIDFASPLDKFSDFHNQIKSNLEGFAMFSNVKIIPRKNKPTNEDGSKDYKTDGINLFEYRLKNSDDTTFTFSEEAFVIDFKNENDFKTLIEKYKNILKSVIAFEKVVIGRMGLRKIYTIDERAETKAFIFNDFLYKDLNDKLSNEVLIKEFNFGEYIVKSSHYYLNQSYPAIYNEKEQVMVDTDSYTVLLIDDNETLSRIFHSMNEKQEIIKANISNGK